MHIRLSLFSFILIMGSFFTTDLSVLKNHKIVKEEKKNKHDKMIGILNNIDYQEKIRDIASEE